MPLSCKRETVKSSDKAIYLANQALLCTAVFQVVLYCVRFSVVPFLSFQSPQPS